MEARTRACGMMDRMRPLDVKSCLRSELLEHGSEAASQYRYLLHAVVVVCLQPVVLLLLTVVPDLKTWLDSTLVITERVIKRDQEHQFWVPVVAKPLQVRIIWVADPIVTLLFACASDIMLAAACTFRPPPVPGGEIDWMSSFAILATAGAIIIELEQLLRGSQPTLLSEIAHHFSDPFNIVDGVSLGVVAIAFTAHVCILASAEDGGVWAGRLLRSSATADSGLASTAFEGTGADGAADATWLTEVADSMSFAVLFLWLRPLRMLYLSPTLGPYLYMLIRMLTEDVVSRAE